MLPLHVDVPMTRLPWVNWVLIGVVTLLSFIGFADEPFASRLGGFNIRDEISIEYDDATGEFVLIDGPQKQARHLPKPILAITSTFVHGGFFHLLGNMVFLFVFGNAVNYKLGHWTFLGVYFLAGFCGSTAHYLFYDVPVVGASGAIYGIVGAFLVFFPRNDVTVLFFFFYRPFWFSCSSFWIILYWVAWDGLFLTIGANQGVALLAHLVGFAAGFSIAFYLAYSRRIESERYEQSLIDIFAPED